MSLGRRVCTAACQMPREESPVWRGARRHVTVSAVLAAGLAAPGDKAAARPVSQLELRAVAHHLLLPHLFTQRDTVLVSFSVKLGE